MKQYQVLIRLHARSAGNSTEKVVAGYTQDALDFSGLEWSEIVKVTEVA